MNSVYTIFTSETSLFSYKYIASLYILLTSLVAGISGKSTYSVYVLIPYLETYEIPLLPTTITFAQPLFLTKLFKLLL